ncbi:MAG: hypothetical protein H8E00_01085 [Deltaproteobacteria bacterium]|nr:hypothetical protein [Deltaproteobacteria bacterium]
MKSFQKIEVFCAIGLFISFFLPWGKLFFAAVSGYDLAANVGGEAKIAWLIPLSSIALIIVAFSGSNTNTDNLGRVSSIIVGALPFIGLFYVLSQVGTDIFEVLAIGAYLSLIIGLILILAGFGAFEPFTSDQNPKTNQLHKENERLMELRDLLKQKKL